MQVVPAALVYSRVRILGAPASIGAMVLQAACLGARDSVTPLGVVLVAGAINGLGDWIAVCRMGMGVFGAAAATASAETVSMLLLGAAVWRAQGETNLLLGHGWRISSRFPACVGRRSLGEFTVTSPPPMHQVAKLAPLTVPSKCLMWRVVIPSSLAAAATAKETSVGACSNSHNTPACLPFSQIVCLGPQQRERPLPHLQWEMPLQVYQPVSQRARGRNTTVRTRAMYSRPETRHTPPALNRANPLPDDAAAISGKRLYSFVALPSWQELKVFLDFAGPIAFALLGKVFGSFQLQQYGFFFFCVAVGFFTARYGQTRQCLEKLLELLRYGVRYAVLRSVGPTCARLFPLERQVLCYSVMTLTVTAIGTIPLATHNVSGVWVV